MYFSVLLFFKVFREVFMVPIHTNILVRDSIKLNVSLMAQYGSCILAFPV